MGVIIVLLVNTFMSSILRILVVAIVSLMSAALGVNAQESTANPEPVYATVKKDAGLFNGGQASFWDLPIIDHFALFGASERARGWSPEQPIKFSHVTHVQKLKLECQYCHWNVAKSPYAAIPEVQTCIGCHALVTGASEEQKKEIAKIKDFYEKKQPIPWEKVHVMPDHVRFNHKRHVKAGVLCSECHGQIPVMQKVERVTSMKMGWCVECHRQRGTSIDCTTCHK